MNGAGFSGRAPTSGRATRAEESPVSALNSRSAAWLRAMQLVLLLVAILFPTACAVNAAAPTSYTLTIYVDEGHTDVVGHVFLGLSDGKNHIYRGFYPKEARTDVFGREIAPFRLGGGEVRDNRDHRWDVKRTYSITKEGFENALQAIELTRTKGSSWCLTNHCGDFASGVANAAGVSLELPQTRTGKNRPALFGAYLRQHGGVTRDQEVARCQADTMTRAEAGEMQLNQCASCPPTEKQRHISQLRQLRDKELKGCTAIGLSPEEQRRAGI
jgi:hypothetical protein